MDRLVTCSFPRTASSFLVESLRVAYPTKEVHHIFHKIDVLRGQDNVISIIRKPEDAVASWLTKIEQNDIEGNLHWYNRFMEVLVKRFQSLVILDFDQITQDVNASIKKCQRFLKLEQPISVDSDLVIEKLKKDLPDRFSHSQNLDLIDKIKESKNYESSFNNYAYIKNLIKEK
jgi:hypothetical protein